MNIENQRWHAILRSARRGAFSQRIVRFVLVGLFNTAFGYGLYLGALRLGLPYPLAFGVALFTSLVVGFLLAGTLVFETLGSVRFALYALTWGAIYLLNIRLLGVVISFGIDQEWAPLAVLPLNVALSYFIQRTIVFRQSR